MSTYANNYYAFLFTYYLVIILMLDKYSSDYSMKNMKSCHKILYKILSCIKNCLEIILADDTEGQHL